MIDVPEVCGQCGNRWSSRACGPTHAVIAARLKSGDNGSCPLCGLFHKERS